jgi:Lon protease-like protein
MKDKMIDQLDAETVEVKVDQFGKLWVNVDGICRLRIGKIKHIGASFDTLTVEWNRPEEENEKA